MRKSALIAATALSAAALFVAAARGQQPPQRAAELPVFGVESVVIAVPVFVVDKNGKAVPGLTQDAFRIEDDGKPVPIVAFQAVDAGAPPLAPGGSQVTRAAARRQFLFLFDLSFSTPDGVRRAREAAMQALDQGLAPGDLAAAATFGSSGVKLLVGFTSDREQLRGAFEDLAGLQRERRPDPLGLAFDMGLKIGEDGGLGLTDRGDKSPRQTDFDEMLRAQLIQADKAERQIYAGRVQTFLDGLEGLSKLLDSIQGRKQVLLLSAGFDPSVLGGVDGAQRAESTRSVTEGRLWEVDTTAHFGDTEATQQMGGLFNALAASDVVIHTLDVTGLGAGAGAEAGGRGTGGAGRGSESLAQLALNSGGRFIKSTNDAASALREILDASRYYYVLAFEPREGGKKPGQLRRLKIKATGDGLKVSHRAAYTLAPAGAREASSARLATADAVVKGLEGGAFELNAVALPYRSAAGAPSLPVVLQIDGAGLVPKGAKGALELEVFGYAFGADGRIEDAVTATPRLDIAQLGATIQAKGVQVLTSLRTTPGPHQLHFLVRERASGRAAALRVSVTVPDFAGPGAVLSPPLFMDDPRARVVVPTASVGLPQLEIPFRLGEVPFVPEAAAVLRNGESRDVSLFTWKAPGLASSELEARLVGGTQPTPLAARLVRSLKDADGFTRLVIALTAKDAPKGDALLELSFRDPDSGQVTVTSAPVRIE